MWLHEDEKEIGYGNNKDNVLRKEVIGLIDYKFFCFNGKPRFLYISRGLENHETAEISFYDMSGEEMPFRRSDYKSYHNALIPSNFEAMKETAARISKNVNCPF